jgi:hypothetical protein
MTICFSTISRHEVVLEHRHPPSHCLVVRWTIIDGKGSPTINRRLLGRTMQVQYSPVEGTCTVHINCESGAGKPEATVTAKQVFELHP